MYNISNELDLTLIEHFTQQQKNIHWFQVHMVHSQKMVFFLVHKRNIIISFYFFNLTYQINLIHLIPHKIFEMFQELSGTPQIVDKIFHFRI